MFPENLQKLISKYKNKTNNSFMDWPSILKIQHIYLLAMN